MDSKDNAPQELFDAGSVRVDQTIQSQSLLDELIQLGLVEIARAASTRTDVHTGWQSTD